MPWSNGLADWVEGDTAYISVAFSWRLQDAYSKAIWYKQMGYQVRAGGIILQIPQNRKILEDVAEFGGSVEAVVHHNPLATFASRGCPVGCWFCIVPKFEGKEFTLIPDFMPRPILCDNNLSQLPVEYQRYVIQRYQETSTPLLDANSGFEPSYFDADTYYRWKLINRGAWRFAFDEMKERDAVQRMAIILKDEPSSKKRVYVLIGNEPIVSCYERVQKVIEWGCEPHCQAVLPLNALTRESFRILYDWDAQKLKDFMRWSNKWLWRHIPLTEYKPRGRQVFESKQLAY